MTPNKDIDIRRAIQSAIDESAPYFGIAGAVAADLGCMVADRIGGRFGGSQVYVRKTADIDRGAIVRDFTGDNIDELAQQHGVTARRIRQLIDCTERGNTDALEGQETLQSALDWSVKQRVQRWK